MQPSSETRGFQQLLEQLMDAHMEEINVLQMEVARLEAGLRNGSLSPTARGRESNHLDVAVSVSSDASSEHSAYPSRERFPRAISSKSDHSRESPSRNGSKGTLQSESSFLRTSLSRFHTVEPEGARLKSYMRALVFSPWFESSFAALIVMNAIVIAFESQYRGLHLGSDLGYPGCHESEPWPHGRDVFSVLSMVFGVIFSAEVAIKMICLQGRFWCECWNVIDFVVVISWCAEVLGRSTLLINPLVIRLARLGRLLRLMRIVRALESMDALYLMTTAIRGSMVILGWSVVLLTVIQMAFALLLNQILHDIYFTDDHYSLDDRRDVYKYFGTFSRSFLSMFELTFANWPTVCRLLTENVTEWFMVFCLLHKLTVGFAVLGVINGVFVQETFKVAATDDTIMVRQKEQAARVHAEKMSCLFREADEDGDGVLSLDEFRNVVADPLVRLWLASMGLDSRDVDTLFRLIDDGDGGITSEELIVGVARLKGAARSIDLNTLMSEHRQLQQLVASYEGEVPAASMCESSARRLKL